MRFAAIADVHGNAWALEAVIADMDAAGITEVVHLGDLFSGPLDAARTAELLDGRGWPTVLGNHDRYLIEQSPGDMGPSDRVAYDQLNPSTLDWLKTLPPSLTLWGEVYACHATPRADDRYWMERVEPDGSIRQSSLAELESEIDEEAAEALLILCAHTHIPRIARLSSGAVLVNPGSVGCPAYDDVHPVPHVMQTGTPNASYAIVTKAEEGWDVSFRSVPYDFVAAAQAARAHGREGWAVGLETGWYPHGKRA
ncbi:MAG: metallophosphoesterase family protein [Pseudomonadota bacterium]